VRACACVYACACVHVYAYVFDKERSLDYGNLAKDWVEHDAEIQRTVEERLIFDIERWT